MKKSHVKPKPVSENPWGSNEKTAVNLGTFPMEDDDLEKAGLDEDKKWATKDANDKLETETENRELDQESIN